MARKRSGAHGVDADALAHFMREKGWESKTLAARSGISLRTIQRALSGERIELSAIDKIADTLHMPRISLLRQDKAVQIYYLPEGGGVEIPIKPDRRFEVCITVAIPFHALNKTERLKNFVGALGHIIHGTQAMQIREVKEGSTVVVIEMGSQDILRLFAAMLDDRLKVLEITTVRLARYDWLKRLVKCMEIFGSPVEPDAETWNEMLNDKMLD